MDNWTGDENNVMRGYIAYAAAMWNRDNPDKPIDKQTLDHLMTALRWATDDMTAEEALDYYNKH